MIHGGSPGHTRDFKATFSPKLQNLVGFFSLFDYLNASRVGWVRFCFVLLLLIMFCKQTLLN